MPLPRFVKMLKRFRDYMSSGEVELPTGVLREVSGMLEDGQVVWMDDPEGLLGVSD